MSADLGWDELDARELADYGRFRVVQSRARSRASGQQRDFHIVDRPPCVQVVARTGDGDFLLVEQYRPAAKVVTLEFPAGVIDLGETPLDAARRELREETGCVAASAAIIGTVDLDPAVASCTVHIVLVDGCTRAAPPDPDAGEEVRVVRMRGQEVAKAIVDRRIIHAGAIAAWHLFGAHTAASE